MVSAPLRLAAGLVVALLTGCAHPTAPPKPTVDADGTIHSPPIVVPPSGFISPEARTTQHDIATHPYPPIPKASDPVEVYQAGRETLNRDVYAPVIARAEARFAVDLSSKTIAGVYADVVTPKNGIAARNKNKILINLHGGAFYNGARTESLVESIPIAAVGRIKVISLDYREGPENKYPAASEDVAAVYKELLKHYWAKNIGIYGCSAGGTLTAQAIAWIQVNKLPTPGAAGIFGAGAVRGTAGDSAYIAPLFAYGQMPPPPGYAGEEPGGYFTGTDPKDPRISPAYDLGTLAKFPSTLILTATRDMALSAAIFTHSQLVKAGADSELHVWEGLTHCFFGDPDLPESQDAYAVITKFFDRHLGK